jgi:DNA-binding transcriptional LysR family regulator
VSSPLVANDYNLLRNFALQGAGIARLPSYLVAPDVAAGRLQRLLPQWHGRGQSLYLVYPQRLPQPARVRALVAFLQQWFAAPAQAALLGQA